MTIDLYTHVFHPGTTSPALLLLHGTGGDEHDLVPLGQKLLPGAALLSPRGNVPENDMPRFFRRFAEGVFDLDDVERRAGELASWIEAARASYGLTRVIAVGFSNGANIAAAMLMRRPVVEGAVLLRAMVTIPGPPRPTMRSTQVLICSGDSDPIAPPDNAARLAATLREAGADVTHVTHRAGHGLVRADLAAAGEWLASRS